MSSLMDVDRRWRKCGRNNVRLVFEPCAGEGCFLGTFAFAKFFEFFTKRLLTLERCPNYIPATGDDVASLAAVLWRLSSRFDFVHGHLAKSQAEDFVPLK
jgi:hypothetical protein